MVVRVAAVIAVLALIGGSIFFVKMSQTKGPDTAGIHQPVEGGANSKLSFDLEDTVPKIDFESIPDIIAEIDGKPLPKDDYVKELKVFQEMVKKNNQPIGQEHTQQIMDQILTKIVDGHVLLEKAKKEGITVDPADAASSLEKMRAGFGDEARFKDFMDSRGFTEESLMNEMKKGMQIRALLDQDVVGKVAVTEGDAMQFYNGNPEKFESKERVHASHILAMANNPQDAEQDKTAKAKAEAILKKLKGGADFAETAKAESDDKGSGANGGDLGFFAQADMVPEFGEKAFSMNPGELSDLVKTQFGYHIILVHEKKVAGKIPFEEVRDNIIQRLKTSKSNDAIFDYINALYVEMAVKVIDKDKQLAAIKPKVKAPAGHDMPM
ncbi:MAG: peptidylprolyl isomerase [Nitrospinota bacterium]|nr:peptidylprolyl isomerase [Nitrospinota bacterium]